MQDSPSSDELLTGISRFLAEQIAPGIADRGQGFRLKIALYLLSVVQRELSHADEHDQREWAGLQALSGQDLAYPSDGASRQGALRSLNLELARSIREDEHADLEAIRAHVLQTLRDKLAVVQPRFDLGPDCETLGKE